LDFLNPSPEVLPTSFKPLSCRTRRVKNGRDCWPSKPTRPGIGHPLALSPRSGRTTSFFNVHFSSLPFFPGRARRTWSIHERSARPISRGIASGSATEPESSAEGHAAPARERMSARNRSRCSVISRIVAGGATVW